MVRWAGWSAVVLFLVTVFVSVAMLFPVVQTWVAGVATGIARQQYGIDLQVQRVSLQLFGPVRLRGVLLRDLNGDTLIHARDLQVKGFRIGVRSHRITARSIRLEHTRFRLVKAEGDATSNLTQVLAKLASGDTSASDAPWTIRCTRLDVIGLDFTYDNAQVAPIPFGVDFDHVGVDRADISAREMNVAGDSIQVMLDRVAVHERSGLDLQQLQGLTTVSPRGIRIQDMQLRTPRTDLHGQLTFLTHGWAAYDAFTDSVQLRLDLDSSRLQFADVALFAPDLEGVDLPIDVSGRFRGSISELKGRKVHLRWGRSSSFIGDADLSGLPGFDTTFIVLNAEELRTDPADLADLPVPPFRGKGTLDLPVEVQRLGPVSFSGDFTGFLNSFTAYGTTTTALGAVRTDMTFDRDTTTHVFRFDGTVRTSGFDLGTLVGDRTIGPLACDVDLHAGGRSWTNMKATIDGDVPLLTFNGSQLTAITVHGDLERDRFDGRLTCRDPGLDMDFAGLADMSRRLPRRKGRVYKVDFTADIRHADLRALNLTAKPGYSSLQARITAQGEVAPDSLKGAIVFENVWLCDADADRSFGDMELHSRVEGGKPVLELRSDMADATVRGEFLPTRLPEAFRSVVFSVFPALNDQVRYAQEEQQFNFDLRLKDTGPLMSMFLPDLQLASGTTASGWFDSRTFDMALDADIPHIAYRGFSGDSVHVIADKTLDVLAFSFRSARQRINDSTWIGGLDMTGKAYQDEMEVSLGWSGSSNGTSGELNLQGQLNGLRSIDVDLLPSRLWFGRGAWSNTRTGHLAWNDDRVRVDSLELWNDGQRVLLDGVVGADAEDALAFSLDDVRLENLAPYLPKPALHGAVGGDGRLFGLLGKPFVLSYLCIDSLAIGRERVGDLRFAATWNEDNDRIDLNGSVMRDSLKALDFSGRYEPGEHDALDVRLTMDRFDLRFLDPYMPEGMSDLQGAVTGSIDVNGPLAGPRIAGSAMIDQGGLRIDYLNTSYTFSHRVDINDDMITLDNVLVHDELGNTARLGGTIIHEGLEHWNFNVWGSMEDMLVLNTTVNDNALYYGKAFATGTFEVSAYAGNLEVTLDAESARGTTLALPLGGSTEVSSIDFVRFLSHGEHLDTLRQDLDLTGVALDMNVRVDRDARFELIFDPTVGDILSGSGEGQVRMSVTPTGEFSMRGGVAVIDGNYLFTMKNVVNKRFDLLPGGTITWYGDPFNATLDLDAVYRVRASLYDILRDKNEAYKNRVPVEVVMNLRDKLMNPTISFAVKLPSVDEGVRTEVNSSLSTEQELNRQVFALIMMNRFLAPDAAGGGSGSIGVATVGTTGYELLSNQVTNWLNQLSDDFDLGFNYRPGDAAANEEMEVNASTQLLDKRLIVSTNVGVQYATNEQRSNQFVGDFQLEYLLTEDGRWRAKAYSQSNDENLSQAQKAPTTQGAGVLYRRDFNNLWRDLFGIGRKRVKVEGARSEPPPMITP